MHPATPAAGHPAPPAAAAEFVVPSRRDGTDLVEVRGLRVVFGEITAVHDLDLQVPAGRSIALVGRNGAGKSTSLKVLAGVLPASGGTVRLAGVDTLRHPLEGKQVTGYCPDVGGLIPRATPWEHLQLAARMRGMGPHWQDRARDLLERFDLGDAAHRVCAGFSHGMSRRLSVLLAGFHRPQVLLLDEPFDGVDPLGVDATLDLVREAREHGSAVLVSTHLLDLAVRCCSEAVVLRGGQQVAALAAGELSGAQGAARYRELLR